MRDRRAVKSCCSSISRSRFPFLISRVMFRRCSVWSQMRVRFTSSLTSSRTAFAFSTNRTRLERKRSSASMLVTLARSDTVRGRGLSLTEIFFDPLGLSHQERCLLVRTLNKAAQYLHRILEILGKFCLLIVLPRVSKGSESGIQGGEGVLKVGIETFQFFCELPKFVGIYNCLRHISRYQIGKHATTALLACKERISAINRGLSRLSICG